MTGILRLATLLVLAQLRSSSLAAELSIDPGTVYDCVRGLGHVTLRWSGAGLPAEVRVGDTKGPLLTGVSDQLGEASTGDWVTDGMVFVLVNSAGQVEASATARVRCGGTATMIDTGAGSAPYFPLQVGNHWVYRVNDRRVTSSYVTRSITHTEQVGDFTYYVLRSNDGLTMRLRADNTGRIWRRVGSTGSERDELVIDGNEAARTIYSGPLGTFADSAAITRNEPLLRQEETYIRGVGPARIESRLLTGSSGGFLSGLDLVEANLEGGIRLVRSMPHISLDVESPKLDVSGKKVTNCAVPSYCVACGLAGADAPGTYKPCFQSRVSAQFSAPFSIELELTDSTGQVVHRPAAIQAPGRELLVYVQIPLYSRPNQSLQPGTYQLTGRLKADLDVVATGVLVVRIE